jgi:hypothetical protein
VWISTFKHAVVVGSAGVFTFIHGSNS